MEITGRLIKILGEVRGETQRGPWVRGGFVIETDGEYPRQVAFTTFGEDRIAMVKNIPMNSPVVVTFNPESREYNEKWYTDLRCSRIQNYVPGQMPPAAGGYAWTGAAPNVGAPVAGAPIPGAPFADAPTPAPTPAPFASDPNELKGDDDLPF